MYLDRRQIQSDNSYAAITFFRSHVNVTVFDIFVYYKFVRLLLHT